jgi:hypothetical protein
VQAFLTSYPVSSPLLDELETTDVENEDDTSEVLLGSLLYPSEGSPPVRLPPIFLVEPCDDPEDAQQWYGLHQGYRYIGQLILPDATLGERVDMVLTQEALDFWNLWLPESDIHQQALQCYQRQQDTLFYLDDIDDSDRQAPGTVGQEQSSLELALQGNEAEKLASLATLAAQPDNVLSPALLFPCLNDQSPLVRQAVLPLLERIVGALPSDALFHICIEGHFSTRLVAERLLGLQGGEESISQLVVLTIAGPLRRERAEERLTLLQALTRAGRSVPASSVDYREVLGCLRDVVESDPVERVQRAAQAFLQSLLTPR